MWNVEEQGNAEKGRTTYCAKVKNNVLWKREEQLNVEKIRTT